MKNQDILKNILNNFIQFSQFEKEIKSSYIDKKKFVMLTFTDGLKARFSIQYSDKLLNGNKIQFKARKNGKWLNPLKNPELNVIKEVSAKPIDGTLTINYASKFKKDEKGEYVFLPRCALETQDKTQKNLMTKLYIHDHQTDELDNILLGYGKITGQFVDKNGTLIVHSIQSFEPELRESTLSLDLINTDFRLNSISANTDYGIFEINASKVPFDFSPGYSEINHIYKGYTITIHSVQRRTGKVEKVDGKWNDIPIWIQDDNTSWDFSNVDINKINKEVASYREKIEENRRFIEEQNRKEFERQKIEADYLRLLDKVKKSTEFQSFSSLKQQFKDIGKEVTDKDLRDLFFHGGYDITIFDHLRQMATETYVDNLSFVFKIPNEQGDKFVWEVPNRTLATYIFNDTLDPHQLFARLKETRRMDIRNNKEIQGALGFDGFIIHTTSEAWIDKFKKVLKY
ncbi:MAG: hypothetical protein ISR83_07310 [Candidatus Marinimicrobia bacterium]|nr:hypothetical protein [Candidatus Neomarinimicrobiota bacterium]